MSSRSVMERNTANICTRFRKRKKKKEKEDVAAAACVVWWLWKTVKINMTNWQFN